MSTGSSVPSSVIKIGESGVECGGGEGGGEGEEGLRLSFFVFLPTFGGGAVRVWFCLLLVDAAKGTTVCVCMCVCVCVCVCVNCVYVCVYMCV